MCSSDLNKRVKRKRRDLLYEIIKCKAKLIYKTRPLFHPIAEGDSCNNQRDGKK